MVANLDFEEQEQLEAFKQFWRKWGVWTTILVLIIVVAFAGWRFYQYHLQKSSAKASVLFSALTDAVNQKNTSSVEQVFSDMVDIFPRTVYAQQAGLLAAKYEFDAGNVDKAISDLTWVTDHNADSALTDLAKLRLSALLLQQGETQKAIALLKQKYDPAYVFLVDDRLGDAYRQQGDQTAAKNAYTDAYQGMAGKDSAYQKIIAVKLNALGVNTSNLAAPS